MKKAYIGVDTSYTPIEYIQSSGTQYIDTGYFPHKTMMEIKFRLNTVDATNGYIAACYNENNNRYYPCAYFGGVGGTKRFAAINKANTSIVLSNADTNDHTVIYNDGSNRVYFDGTQKSTVSDLDTQAIRSIFLFALNGGSGVESFFKGRIYYVKIWEKISGANLLVRDLVPALDQANRVGMFDLVEEKFYPNKGTGDFTAGNVIGTEEEIGEKALLTKKGYIGVNNVARLIRKVYVGDNGVARRIYGNGKYKILFSLGDYDESGGLTYKRITNSSDNKDYASNSRTYHDYWEYFYFEMVSYGSYNSYGGLFPNKTFDMSKYSMIFVKSKTSNIGTNNQAYIATFPEGIYNLANAEVTKNIIIAKNSSGTVTIDNTPNFLFPISKTDTREIAVGEMIGGFYANSSISIYAFILFEPDDLSGFSSFIGIQNPTISDVLSNASTILSNQQAVEYLILCTGDFMASALMDSTFMTELESSAYKTTILANSDWKYMYDIVTKTI